MRWTDSNRALKGHDFSRASSALQSTRALAPEGVRIGKFALAAQRERRFAFTWFALLVLFALPAIAQSTTPVPPSPANSQAEPAALPDALPPAPVQVRPPQPASATPNAQPEVLVRSDAKSPITILEDTQISVITTAPIGSRRVKNGTPLLFMVSDDVVIGDALVIPRGATVHGEVVRSKKSGVLTGSPELTFKLVSLDLGGRSYPLYTYQFQVKSLSKTKPTERKAVRGAYVGAIAGAFAGGVSSKGVVTTDATSRAANMTAGAVVGAGVGTAVSAASPGPEIWIPGEAQVDFYLASPITVTPVSQKEAARLVQGLHSGGPTLYVRGDTP